jgi:hypothetical protein
LLKNKINKNKVKLSSHIKRSIQYANGQDTVNAEMDFVARFKSY